MVVNLAASESEVSNETVELRTAIAKALWRDSIGEENLPADPMERSEEFSKIRPQLVRRAIKIEQWLNIQGYKIAKY